MQEPATNRENRHDACVSSPTDRHCRDCAGLAAPGAQQGFTDAFPPEEFAARRATVRSIGDGVAILQGTTERRGESPLRQSNQFFYLTGVTEPRALLISTGGRRRRRCSSPRRHRGASARSVRIST